MIMCLGDTAWRRCHRFDVDWGKSLITSIYCLFPKGGTKSSFGLMGSEHLLGFASIHSITLGEIF